MIGLKKMYSEELLRLALVLSLLRSDPEQYLRDDLRLIAGVNGSDWAPEITRSQYLHPKSIDSMLMNYERDLFEELQSLGRWGDTGSAREAIQAYLLNGVESNVQQAPVQLSQSAPDDHQNYTSPLENDDVEQCVTIKTDEDNLLDEVEDNTSAQNTGNVIDSITFSASFIRNLSTFQGPLMEEDSANSVPFDVSQFFANPPEIKKENAEAGATVDDFYDEDDNAIDDFVPYYNLRGDRDSITHQNLADLNDFEETPETLKEFKKKMEKVNEKLNEGDVDFEKYLIQNTDLDEEHAKLVAIKNEDDSASYSAFIAEDLVNEVCIKTEEDDEEDNAFGTYIHPSSSSFSDAFNVKRERGSTSFTSAGSSGVGDEAYASSSSSEGPYELLNHLKIERDEGYGGDELTQEDMDLIEVLWKQDVDMGFSIETPQAVDPTKCVLPETFQSIMESSCPTATDPNLSAKMRKEEMDEIDRLKESLKMSCEGKCDNQDRSGSSLSSSPPDEDLWAGLDYTVDTETGEYVLSSELRGDRFSLLEEALQLVDIHESTPSEDIKSTPINEEAGASSSSGLLADSAKQKDKDLLLLDGQQDEQGEEEDMLAGRYGPAGPYHHHNHHHQQHLAAAYHHQNLVRSMSMEQRWQDLATLLALPAQQVAQHEQHELYHHHHQHLGHGAQMSPSYVVPPYTPLTDKTGLSTSSDIYGASNLGSAVAASMSVSHHSHHQQTQPQQQQQQHVHQPQAQPQPATGVQQHHAQAQHHQGQQGAGGGFYKPEHQEPESCYYQSNSSSELNATSDGFLQSILNDDDLQLMDMAMSEGMYTMRMLESAGGVQGATPIIGPQSQGHLGAAMSASATALGGGGALGNGHLHHHSSAPLIPQHLTAGHNGLLGHHNMSMGSERIDASSDSAVSSMGSERVPSLSDSEWCDGGSDSAQDYHGKMRPDDVEARQVPLVAQKKHQMFGKRCFQDQAPSVIRPRPNMEPPSLLQPPPPLPSSLKYEYDHHTSLQAASYAPDHGHITPEMKYSCTMEFNRDIGSVAAARHNHTYSLPPAPPQPPHRPLARDKRGRRGMDMNVGNCSGSGPLTRDEKRARALGIPLTVQDIINLPMDEFNERLSKHDLTETQLSLIRDIRRRGKNKVAAQNCRKRKLDQITSLADEVRDVRSRKMRLQREHQQLLGERQRSKEHFAALYRHVFQHLRDSDGNPLSSQQYSLQQAADGAVVLVPRGSLSSGTLLPTVRSPDSQDRHMSTNGTSEDEMERIKIKQRKSYEQ